MFLLNTRFPFHCGTDMHITSKAIENKFQLIFNSNSNGKCSTYKSNSHFFTICISLIYWVFYWNKWNLHFLKPGFQFITFKKTPLSVKAKRKIKKYSCWFVSLLFYFFFCHFIPFHFIPDIICQICTALPECM